MSIIERHKKADESKLVDVEKGVVNKFRWEWMERVVEFDPLEKFPKLNWTHGSVRLTVKDHIRKIDQPGKVVCILCSSSDSFSYADGGVQSITNHLKTKKHLKKLGALYQNQMLPGAHVPSDEMYGAPIAFYGDTPAALSSNDSTPSRPTCHVLDRVANYEAMIVAFTAEHSLSFNTCEGLVELAKELAKDEAALKRVKMHRTTASYKLVYGLGLTWRNELISCLKITPFSLNMDESTSTNTKHVFTILVSYYNSSTNNIAVDHLASVDVPSCTSENLYTEVTKIFEEHDLPWEKLLAILSDSASTMRGKVSGLETLIRQSVAPHLLDIDGESCHHMHNVVKKFTSFFEFFLENLFRDVSNEFKYCAGSLALLEDVTFHMQTTYRKPIDFHLCRWLSVYDASVEFDAMVSVHKVFFSAFEKADLEMKLAKCRTEIKKLNAGSASSPKNVKLADSDLSGRPKPKTKKDLKTERKELIKKEKKLDQVTEKIVNTHKVTEESKEALKDLEVQLMNTFKAATEKGKERKRRVVASILYQPTRYDLLVSFYKTVLPLFKGYVLVFQSDTPIIHKVYYKQVSLVKEFYSYFVNPSVLEKCKTAKQLLALDLKKENLLPSDLMFVGIKAKKLIEKLGKKHADVVYFLDKVEKAYVQCGEYIQSKLPLENKSLKALTSIDPLLVSNSNKNHLRRFLSLPTIMPTILSADEEELYEKEVRSVCVDSLLPSARDDQMNEVNCLDWWTSINNRYPTVFKMVTAVLSIFHGPRVESTFNVMGDVLDKKSGRMNMETYSAIQDIKYGLKTRQPLAQHRAVSTFAREDRLHTPVNSKLSNNMRNSRMVFNNVQMEKRKRKVQRMEEFKVKNAEVRQTAKKLKIDAVSMAEKSKEDHQKALDDAYTLRRLVDTPPAAEPGDIEPSEIDMSVESVMAQKEPIAAVELVDLEAVPVQAVPESVDEYSQKVSPAGCKDSKKNKRKNKKSKTSSMTKLKGKGVDSYFIKLD